MKTSFLAALGWFLLAVLGAGMWYLLRFGGEAVYSPFLPEVAFLAFFLAGFFVFLILRKTLKTRAKILAYDQELRHKNEMYDLISGGLDDGIWDWDFKTGKVFFSDEWKKLLEFKDRGRLGARFENSPEGLQLKAQSADAENSTVPGKVETIADFEDTADWWAGRIHPDDIDQVKQQMDLHFAGQKPFYEAEYRFLNGKQEYVWIIDRGRAVKDARGKLSHMAGITSSIQDLKNVEKVLKGRTSELEAAKAHIESEKAQTETVLESIGEGVIAVDKKGLVTVANPAGANMLGLSKEDMIGMTFANVIPKEEDRKEQPTQKEDRLVYQTLATGKKYSATSYYYRSDDAKFPAAVTSAPIVLDGALAGAIVVFRDTTREMEIDKQKTEFVSLASHQLRTPLSAVRWYSEMVLGEKIGPLNDKQRKYVQEVYDSNLRMIELVNALLNVSRIELGTFAVEPSEVNLGEMFESVVDELMPAMRAKNLHFEKHYENAPKAFFVDPNLMRIVFQNLLSNSVKYTPEGGSVGISVEEVGAYLRVKVYDTGYGIPKADQPKMFTKLFRASNVTTKDTEGTGLGLYIIKSVVEKTGGRIWFESEENKGTTFFVELPMKGMSKIEGTKGLEP
ncbi:MAG TPA: ATP-binding protein [Candidatus Paceibacterota bacterium]|nr:ATP-binding protein [Candidatus Paceibacterota bacterium]